MPTTYYFTRLLASTPMPTAKQSTDTITDDYATTYAKYSAPCLLSKTKGNQDTQVSRTITEPGSAHYTHFGTWITEALPEQVVSGTVDINLIMYENVSGINMLPRVLIYVWKADNTRGAEILAATTSTVEADHTMHMKKVHFSATPITSVHINPGDKIAIEIETYDNNTLTSSCVQSMRFGGGGEAGPAVYGCDYNPTGDPIGGGTGYSNIFETGTYIVTSKAELLAAIATPALPGQTIYVTEGTTIDLSGDAPVTIPAGVTLASNRGISSSTGAKITKTTPEGSYGWAEAMFIAENGVRVTGLWLLGEDFPENEVVYDESTYLVGVFSDTGNSLIVDNCEVDGWAWAGVRALGSADVHHNYIHNCMATGEGYGIVVEAGQLYARANIFDYNRHSIAAGGLAGEGYTAQYNHVLGHGDPIGGSSFDVHLALGNNYVIQYNTFDEPLGAVPNIGGFVGLQDVVPTGGLWVDHNIMYWNPAWDPHCVFITDTATNERTHVSANMAGLPTPELKSGETGVVSYTG